MNIKESKKGRVLMFSATRHPLLSDIQKELQKHCDTVILYHFLTTGALLKFFFTNILFFCIHIKYVILFIKFIFDNLKFFNFRTLKWYYLNLLYLLFLDKKYSFDIIDAHWIYPAGLIATTYSKYFPKRVIITVHGYDARKEDLQKNPKLIKLIVKTASLADSILTAEKKLYENLTQHGIKKIIHTNQFVDLEEFGGSSANVRNELKINHDSFVVGFGPHIKEAYGIMNFVDAMILVHEEISNLFVICLGVGDKEEYVKKKFNQNGIKFLMPGKILREIFINYIKACDIICIPGFITQGIFALEAFACSKPTIGYTNIHELKIEDQITGQLVKKGDFQSMSKEVIRLYKDSSLRMLLGKNARKKVETYYTKEKRISDILRAYGKV